MLSEDVLGLGLDTVWKVFPASQMEGQAEVGSRWPLRREIKGSPK